MTRTKSQPATLGERIKARRIACGLSQVELAERLGVHQVAVHSYESGKRQPNPAGLRALATVLGCTIDELVP